MKGVFQTILLQNLFLCSWKVHWISTSGASNSMRKKEWFYHNTSEVLFSTRFSQDFLHLLSGSFIGSEELSSKSDEYQPMKLPHSQNPAQKSQWKFTAAHQSNLAWGNWVTCWQILPFEVIKNHTSGNPLMTQLRSQRTEVIMCMNHALSSSVLAIIDKTPRIFGRLSPQCESL